MFAHIIRRAGLAAVASTVALTSLGVAAAPITASATAAGGCVVAGSATITPGLGAAPGPQSVTFSGTGSPCAGPGVVPGSFSGTVTCALGNLVTCAGVASFAITASPYGTCHGVLLQQGAVVETGCTADAGTGAVVSVAVFTPNPLVQTTVSNVNFQGVAAGAQA
jgi:hypothetical protein